jgi:hypothetical protein
MPVLAVDFFAQIRRGKLKTYLHLEFRSILGHGG